MDASWKNKKKTKGVKAKQSNSTSNIVICDHRITATLTSPSDSRRRQQKWYKAMVVNLVTGYQLPVSSRQE
jgi:hypothetical protein